MAASEEDCSEGEATTLVGVGAGVGAGSTAGVSTTACGCADSLVDLRNKQEQEEFRSGVAISWLHYYAHTYMYGICKT
jgi:hypothetical protein